MSAEISNKKKMECSVRTIDKRKKGDILKSDIVKIETWTAQFYLYIRAK
ncbi:hypothetical protein [Acinetobacter guillouiae]|uniref:Uncharacterized protein n=1 Tax=Acinetobacter guillouiae NIPH 991 TaxID=1217656 RepID=N8YAL5_ACIGI|nr:hypothetical protein [Acinetobacter guillouiae]ENV16658.1 hypothetical protein F964_02406 [Acinetobacter guillouiae NIPH 991]